MTDGDFRLIAASGDIIDLNSLTDSLTGVQAIAGLTGFGLPSVEAQYQVGAGDGATFRGARVSPRDIDIPIFIAGDDRNAMREQINRLARALAKECILQWEDDDTVWEQKVRRVGGGEFVYGTDTDGSTYLQTTITMRSGDPYWKSSEPFHLEATAAAITYIWDIPGEALGNAPSRPIIRVTGPTLGFTISDDPNLSHDTAQILRYTAFVPAGETITVDMEKGTVLNLAGASMYNNLAPNPRFFAVDADPAGTALYIATDNSSPAFLAAPDATAYTNLVPNPDIVGKNGWTIIGAASGTTTQIATFSSDTADGFDGKPDVGYVQFVDLAYGNTAPENIPYLRANLNGLVVGKQYDLLMKIDQLGTYPATGQAHWPGQATVNMATETQSVNFTPGEKLGWRTLRFTASSASGYVTLRAPYARAADNSATNQISMRVGKYAVVPAGTPYFDGNSKNANYTRYSWFAAVNNSVSIANHDNNPAYTKVELDLYKRNWLVV